MKKILLALGLSLLPIQADATVYTMHCTRHQARGNPLDEYTLIYNDTSSDFIIRNVRGDKVNRVVAINGDDKFNTLSGPTDFGSKFKASFFLSDFEYYLKENEQFKESVTFYDDKSSVVDYCHP